VVFPRDIVEPTILTIVMKTPRPSIDPEHLWRAPEQIVLLPHDPRWLTDAADECRRILDACAPVVLRVEHIGSTCVPGLISKPVLDLMPLVTRFDEAFVCVATMRALGYWYAGEFGIAGRHLFVRGSPRTHHAHMLVHDSKEARRHLAVRDVLRAHPELAARYAALKQDLAPRFGSNREGYAEAKAAFMRELFQRAGVD
jgi:GrpB-like predicted nucleotidyltransferase (UPF0157 family)